MKLHELGAQRPTEHIAKTLRSHMGHAIDFDRITEGQAKKMLSKTQALLREYRTSVSRHYSERNPDYIKLVMVEQALKQRLGEQMPAATPGAAVTVDPARQAAMATAQQQQKKRDIQDQIRGKQQEIQQLQRAMNQPLAMAEERVEEKYMGFKKTVAAIKKGGSARDPEAVAAAIGRKKYGKERFQKAAAAGKKLGERRIMEASEIQTAQVVLASQDMIDKIQGMMEDISEMQFKDLPALTDTIKNDMGVEQASQFQSQASAALTNLLAAVQAGKTELEGAQGVLTGQAPQVPGVAPDATGTMGAPAPAAGGDIEADMSLDANLPAPEAEPEEETPAATLGRERR